VNRDTKFRGNLKPDTTAQAYWKKGKKKEFEASKRRTSKKKSKRLRSGGHPQEPQKTEKNRIEGNHRSRETIHEESPDFTSPIRQGRHPRTIRTDISRKKRRLMAKQKTAELGAPVEVGQRNPARDSKRKGGGHQTLVRKSHMVKENIICRR